MDQVLQDLRGRLRLLGDETVREKGKRFFKETVVSYGIKVPEVGRIAKELFKEIKPLGKEKIFRLCGGLWESGYIEESFIACEWAYLLHEQYLPRDFKVLENWIGCHVSNWASCDTLCNHSVGTFLEMYPDYIEKLIHWAESPNMWMRRAAAVSLIIPARKGMFLKEIFKIADLLLTDKEDLVQKGYGWMLKAASEAHQKAVFDFIMLNKEIMPRTALRYGIEKMPKELKARAMHKGGKND